MAFLGVDSFRGIWCDWITDEYGSILKWNGGEKFYSYGQWLVYLHITFFEPWGIVTNGDLAWQGEDPEDQGNIRVVNNVISLSEATVSYSDYRQVYPSPLTAKGAPKVAANG